MLYTISKELNNLILEYKVGLKLKFKFLHVMCCLVMSPWLDVYWDNLVRFQHEMLSEMDLAGTAEHMYFYGYSAHSIYNSEICLLLTNHA